MGRRTTVKQQIEQRCMANAACHMNESIARVIHTMHAGSCTDQQIGTLQLARANGYMQGPIFRAWLDNIGIHTRVKKKKLQIRQAAGCRR
jgi:hypothetical protein